MDVRVAEGGEEDGVSVVGGVRGGGWLDGGDLDVVDGGRGLVGEVDAVELHFQGKMVGLGRVGWACQGRYCELEQRSKYYLIA